MLSMDNLLIFLEKDDVVLAFFSDSQNDSSCGTLLEGSAVGVTVHHARGSKSLQCQAIMAAFLQAIRWVTSYQGCLDLGID
jgi:hypothetical protein